MKFEQIIANLKSLKTKVDAIIISSYQNRLWATAFNSSAGVLIVTKKGHIEFLIDGRYINTAHEHFLNSDVNVDLVNNYQQAIFDCLKKLKIKNIGFESDHITVAALNQFILTYTNDKLRFIPIDTSKWRQIKSKSEIKKLQMAADIIGAVFSDLTKFIKPEMTELDVAGYIYKSVIDKGGELPSFPPIVASGINGANPHAHPSNKKITVGELITIDMGAIYCGYCSDMTRNIVVGKLANDKIRSLYQIVHNAQAIGLDAIKSGEKCCEIDACVRGYIKNLGYGEYFNHGLGHGLGIDVHEEPYLNHKCETILENNMVVTVEPGIYLPNEGGVRIEDDVLVSDDKAIVLTKTTKNLINI